MEQNGNSLFIFNHIMSFLPPSLLSVRRSLNKKAVPLVGLAAQWQMSITPFWRTVSLAHTAQAVHKLSSLQPKLFKLNSDLFYLPSSFSVYKTPNHMLRIVYPQNLSHLFPFKLLVGTASISLTSAICFCCPITLKLNAVERLVVLQNEKFSSVNAHWNWPCL